MLRSAATPVPSLRRMTPNDSTRSIARIRLALGLLYVGLCVWAMTATLIVTLDHSGDGLEFLAPVALGLPWSVLAFVLNGDPPAYATWTYYAVLWSTLVLPQVINASLIFWWPWRYLKRRPARRRGGRSIGR